MKHKKCIVELDHQGVFQVDFDIGILILHTSYFGPQKYSLMESKEILQITCYFLILECKSNIKLSSCHAKVEQNMTKNKWRVRHQPSSQLFCLQEYSNIAYKNTRKCF